MLLDRIRTSRWRALLSAALSLFLLKPSTVSDCADQHPNCINPDVVLFGAAACLFPLDRISCRSCPLLPRPTGLLSVHWFVHLRRFMRLLLFCGINLLYPHPRERTFLASAAIGSVFGAIYLCVKLQGDGGHTPGNRFNL